LKAFSLAARENGNRDGLPGRMAEFATFERLSGSRPFSHNRTMQHGRFEVEFGPYTEWLADAIQALDFPDPIPAACRGTGNPSLLDHLAGGLEIEAGALVLDVGMGLGGPAAWLVRERSCRLVGIDVMVQSPSGARRLFEGIDVAVASSEALPFREQTFDGAWALGVIELLEDKGCAFREIARVLAPGARLVLYDFVAIDPDMEASPVADRFEPAGEIKRKLEESGLRVLLAEAVPAMSSPPEEWGAAVEKARDWIREAHGGDRRLSEAEKELGIFNRLRDCGSIQAWEFVAERIAR
jgi:SAM-dependent methyltransferase